MALDRSGSLQMKIVVFSDYNFKEEDSFWLSTKKSCVCVMIDWQGLLIPTM